MRSILSLRVSIAGLQVSLGVFALAGGTPAAEAQTPGPEFQVNGYTTGNQRRPSVSVDGSGKFLVAWASAGSSETDSDGSIQLRRFDAAGAPLGNDLQVNIYTTGGVNNSAVATNAAGQIVIAWDGWGSYGTDTSSTSIQVRRFDVTGNPIGGQFQVNTYTTGYQSHPKVAVSTTGSFIVVWHSQGSPTDNDYGSIQARRFDADGNPLGGQIQANSYTTGNQSGPSVAVDSAGRFVIAWQSLGSSGTDTSEYSIQARRFNADGNALGGQFQVNNVTTWYQTLPAVAVDNDGDAVIVWSSDWANGTDLDGSVQARRFDANGNPLGSEFQVNNYTTGSQGGARVAVDGTGRFIVSWVSDGSSGTDSDTSSIQARRFAESGAPLGTQFQVNSYTPDSQHRAAVAADSAGNFVVTWESNGSSGTDSSGASIEARQYFMPFFGDGFEDGTPCRWSGFGGWPGACP